MEIIRDIKSVPVLRPLAGLMLGIIAADLPGFHHNTEFLWLTIFLVFLAFLLLGVIALKPSLSYITGVFVFTFFICSGIFFKTSFHKSYHLIPEGADDYWLGETITTPELKNQYARCRLYLFKSTAPEIRYETNAFFNITEGSILPQAGQFIFLKTTPQRIAGPMNPGEFDYAGYLKNSGILYQCFIKPGEWKNLGIQKRNTIRLLTLRIRDNLWNKIESLEPQNKNLGVLYAIALGSKDMLTQEIRESYAATGAMHVLVVSGQHVALIWLVLSYLFIWMRDIPGGKYIQFFLITGLIWFYSLMTGMTASIVRSAIMFTLVSLGKIIQKESSIYNSLAVSAFFILVVNPQWLTDAGFQLSYIAVLSIVFFQPRIVALASPGNWLLQKMWDIVSVSIAAQIGTLPLTLFYFNRFPPWFILSNLVVIPLVTLIMVVFIVLLLFLLFPVIFSFILKFLLFLIGIMNTSVSFIETLPSPSMDMIYINNPQMFCFVLCLLGISLFIRYRNGFFFILGMLSLLFFICAGVIRNYQILQKRELVLFSTPGKMIMGMIDSNKGVFLHNSSDSADFKATFNYKCKPYLMHSGIRHPFVLSLEDSISCLGDIRKIPGKNNYYLVFEGKSVIILNDPWFYKGMQSETPLKSDLLIVNSGIPYLWKNQKPVFDSDYLLVSTSVSTYTSIKSDKELIIITDSIFDTRHSGVFSHSSNNLPNFFSNKIIGKTLGDI